MEIRRSVASRVVTPWRENNLAVCQSTFPSPLKKVPDRKSFSVYPAVATHAILTRPPPPPSRRRVEERKRGPASPRRKGGYIRVTDGDETSPSVWSANTVIAWNIILGTPSRMRTGGVDAVERRLGPRGAGTKGNGRHPRASRNNNLFLLSPWRGTLWPWQVHINLRPRLRVTPA